MIEFEALANCASSGACIVNQVTSGLIIGMLLFLVASGLTLIFGVLNIINFAHGSFYMMGAYVAFTAYALTGNYFIAAIFGAIGAGLLGVFFERFIISRVYGQNVLLQLLVCYAFILIMDDVVKLVWGAEYLAMGIPDEFRLAPIRLFGGFIPPLYIFLIITAVVIGFGAMLLIAKTRFGSIVRAIAENPSMVGALGIRVPLYLALLFAIGCALAGVAGALAAPVRSLTPGMGLGILVESFIVTVIGGMGSIPGAFFAALILGLTRAIGSIGFPLFVDGAMFMMMALVLIFKPTGLLGGGGVKR
jgi:Branched-chain amino acid ABC-type transport system, permease components|tara:strand:+ start:1470 stop:2381 length:912 start_codon:yes stop_codon:yes gene_type:complete